MNEVVIEGVESGAGFEATAVGVMVGVTAMGVMPGAGMEMAGAIGGGVTETGEPPAVTVGPGFVPVGSGELVKEEGVAGWLAGAPAGAVVPLLAGGRCFRHRRPRSRRWPCRRPRWRAGTAGRRRMAGAGGRRA